MVKEIVYNKLIRDNILEIVEADNKIPIYHIADKKEYKKSLFNKLYEELDEFKFFAKKEGFKKSLS